MMTDSKPKIYAMIGPMGSGKSTMAMKIAQETGALYLSLDGTIKSFNVPIKDLQDYESHMERAHTIMYQQALEALRGGRSVAFDVARWQVLDRLSEETETEIIVYYFEISAEELWRRVQKRNLEKPHQIYHFTMSKEEFDAQDPRRNLPHPRP